MGNNKIVWLFLFIGSAVGSYLPALWGDGTFSASSILFSTLGALIGVFLGYRISKS